MFKVKRSSLYNLAHKNGAVFTITFTKKDGTERVMNCRTGVKSHLKGGECAIPKHLLKGKPYVVVFDMQKGEYRVFNAETATVLKMGGNTYQITD